MMGAAILTNLPALLVVVPLLLAPFSAVLPIAGLAWVLALVGTGISFLAALMLQSVTENGVRISYHLGNWEPPWGIEFVVNLNRFLQNLFRLYAFYRKNTETYSKIFG